jgi:LysR family glycine cleavage system transcriptional activator
MRLPPIHTLLAFEAAARHGSFVKAAEELHVTESAVSHRVRQLERLLGAKVLLRLNRNVVPTPTGTRFLEAVRGSLVTLQEAMVTFRGSERVALRISVAPAFASTWIAPRIANFQVRHPTIDLEIQVTSRIVNLRAERIDVAVRFGDGHWPSYHVVKLADDELFPVCSPTYLAKADALRSPEDLSRVTLLRCPHTPWRLWFRAVGLEWPEPTSGPLFSEVNAMLDAAEAGAGIALGLRVTATPYITEGRLVRVFPMVVRSTRSYYAVCLAERLADPPVGALLAWLEEEARR